MADLIYLLRQLEQSIDEKQRIKAALDMQTGHGGFHQSPSMQPDHSSKMQLMQQQQKNLQQQKMIHDERQMMLKKHDKDMRNQCRASNPQAPMGLSPGMNRIPNQATSTSSSNSFQNQKLEHHRQNSRDELFKRSFGETNGPGPHDSGNSNSGGIRMVDEAHLRGANPTPPTSTAGNPGYPNTSWYNYLQRIDDANSEHRFSHKRPRVDSHGGPVPPLMPQMQQQHQVPHDRRNSREITPPSNVDRSNMNASSKISLPANHYGEFHSRPANPHPRPEPERTIPTVLKASGSPKLGGIGRPGYPPINHEAANLIGTGPKEGRPYSEEMYKVWFDLNRRKHGFRFTRSKRRKGSYGHEEHRNSGFHKVSSYRPKTSEIGIWPREKRWSTQIFRRSRQFSKGIVESQ